MKKQIAILATIIAASGFTAFGQDYISFGTSTHGIVYDGFTTPGTPTLAGAGDINVEFLWATTGASDPFAGGSSNGVSGATSEADISALLADGWTLGQNGGTTVESSTEGAGSKAGQITPYVDNPFEVTATSTGLSGSDIQLIFIAFNGAASSYNAATVAGVGFSNPLLEPIGSAASDPNADYEQNAVQNEFTGTTGPGTFYVDPVPEPTTLALAGLGGLSMLFLRRRKV